MPLNPAYADAIAKIESGGNYGILGPVTKSGDRAYGKYQVMGANIPVWTKEILGAPMTPEEFRANPQAQDAVFQGKFGQYVEKYGQEGAARAWFGGPGAVNAPDRKDQLGTTVGGYGQKFMAGLGSAGGANNAPAPISGPQLSEQAPPLPAPIEVPRLPATPYQPPTGPPLNILPPAATQQMQSLAQYLAPQQPQQQSPMQAPDMPAPLNAPPPIQQMAHQINLLRAFSRIPTPTGFRGFRYS